MKTIGWLAAAALCGIAILLSIASWNRVYAVDPLANQETPACFVAQTVRNAPVREIKTALKGMDLRHLHDRLNAGRKVREDAVSGVQAAIHACPEGKCAWGRADLEAAFKKYLLVRASTLQSANLNFGWKGLDVAMEAFENPHDDAVLANLTELVTSRAVRLAELDQAAPIAVMYIRLAKHKVVPCDRD